MKTKALLVILTMCLAGAGISFAAGEQEIRDLDEQWSKTAGTKDVEKTISFYSDDANVMPPNGPAATTKDAIRNAWKNMLTTPGATISWKATKVEVAKSGDIAFSSGTYEYSMTDASGKTLSDRGKYLAVWEKQADGKWKCGADIWNSDLPPVPPAPAEKK